MPNPLLSQIVLPVDVEGTLTNVTFDIKDAEARQAIADLGHTLYWVGVTTTALSDGATTNPITVGGEQVEVEQGAVAQYVDQSGEATEFVFNGTAWQQFAHSNLGALAFKSSAEGSYTPAGNVSITPSQEADTTTSVTPFGTAGSIPSWSVSGEVATFNAGTAATAGTPVDVVTASGAVSATAAFTGTAATITVQ